MRILSNFCYTIPGNILDTVFCVKTQFELTLFNTLRLLGHTNKKTNNAVAIIIDYYKKYNPIIK